MPTSINFMENYKICCSDSKTRLKVKSLSQDKSLQFNADRLDAEDWVPLTRALKYDRSLHTLIIKSEYHDKKWRSTLMNNVKPSIYKPNVMQDLIESITVCMKESKILSTLQLQSLPLNKNHIDTLLIGISECKSLQHLALTRCQLSDNSVKIICHTIKTHTGIQTINLSGCSVTKEGARYIAELIRVQRLVRYSETWKQSLRYREPNPDLLPGIRRITLNDNPEITDEGFALIKHELMDDLWIKAIDMQNCGLSIISGSLSIELLEINTTIIVLDIRRNDNINHDTVKAIKTLLTNRCVNVTARNCDHDIEHDYNKVYDWLDGTSSSVTRSEICSSRKPNSEFSINTVKNSNTNRFLLTKTNSLTDELNHPTRKFNNITTCCLPHRRVLELKEHEKQNELTEKLVKEWNRRKLIEKERDRLKEKLHNYTTETNTNNSKNANHLQQSKSLNFNHNNNNNNLNKKINTTKSLSALSSPSSKSSKKIKKRNRKLATKNKINIKNGDENKQTKKRKNNSKRSSRKSDEGIRNDTEKPSQKSLTKQNQNELLNIQENLEKIKMKQLQFDENKNSFIENEDNNRIKTDEPPRNEMKKDFRDLSPTSRSQWILKELMSNKNGHKNNITENFNKYEDKFNNNNYKKTEPANNFRIDNLDHKWDLKISI